MTRIHGRLSSINVRKVVWAAQEAGIAFSRVDVGGAFGGVDTAQFRRLNPNAMVPVLEDGDVVLWESNVIVRYLCARYGEGSLYPTMLRERFISEQWMDWQQTTLNPAGRAAFLQLVRTPSNDRDDALIAQSVAATEPLLDLIERHLTTQPFIAADRFTMADIPIGCEVHRWYALPLARAPRPRLERWFGSLRARPAARGVLDVELE